jgi:putative flippase GtrA
VRFAGLQWWRIGRFSLVGLLGAALQLFLLHLLTAYVHLCDVAATPIAVEIAVLHNFAWHERFTWCDRSARSLPQRAVRFWRFHAGNGLISLCGKTVLIYCLVERLQIPVMASAIVAIALFSLVNSLLADYWVYAPESSRSGQSGTERHDDEELDPGYVQLRRHAQPKRNDSRERKCNLLNMSHTTCRSVSIGSEAVSNIARIAALTRALVSLTMLRVSRSELTE